MDQESRFPAEAPILVAGNNVAPCLQRLSSPGRGPRVCYLRREIAAMSRAIGSTALIRSLASFSALSQVRRRRDFDMWFSSWPARSGLVPPGADSA